MKYLIHNDISYIIHKKRTILVLLWIVPLVILLLNINHSSITYAFQRSMGLQLDIHNIDTVQLISYLFNVFGFIYLIVDIYLKDLNENLENIFLRMKPNHYILRKNICFIAIMIIIKMIQYMLMVCLFMVISKQSFDIQIIHFALTDIVYILLIQYLFLLIYLFYILLKKNMLFMLISIVILMIVFPKGIWNLHAYNMCIVIVIILLQLIINRIFKTYSKRIIENI